MFTRLGTAVFDHRRAVLAGAALLLAVAAGWGTSVFGSLVGGGFEDPGSESKRAAVRAEEALGRQGNDVLVVYSSERLTVEDPAFEDAVTEVLDGLPSDVVTGTTSYWSTDSPDFVSSDGRSTFVALQLRGDTDGERGDAYEQIADDLLPPEGFEVLRGGTVAADADITHQVEQDIARAELISMPVLLVLLLVVFGGLAAAGLPLLVGGVSIMGAFLALRLISTFTDVSVFAINIITMLGLGLAIDYALFVVSRFREELSRRPRADDPLIERQRVRSALAATMDTAGRTVAVSGVVVTVALASLLFFPQLFLRSMGLGGISAVVVAVTAALTVLPAMLAVLGRRVDALRLPLPRRSARTSGEGAWSRLAHGVMRRPVPVALATVAVLAVLGAPALGATFGGVDTRVLPEGTESRVAMETLERDFPAATASPVEVVVTGTSPAALGSYVESLAALPGTTGATVAGQGAGTAVIEVGYDGAALKDSAHNLVADVRELPAPQGAEVMVGGQTAAFEDLLTSLGQHAPQAIGFVVATTLVLLFLAFGSVVLPIKAVLMNVLSLGATVGVLVWGFQEGNLAGLLGFTETGTIEATQPVLILAIAFGLSMDYEVFLLSRIREEWDRTGDNTRAVAAGLQRTGSIITSAAALILVVFLAFGTSGITVVQMVGVGLAVAVVVDATIVRALLVPATMRLLGRANWWLPRPLRRIHDRFGLQEADGSTRPETFGDASPPEAAPADDLRPPAHTGAR
jgi:RND superfamily putative drug exporter